MIRIVTADYLAQLHECIRLHEELRDLQARSISTQKATIEILQDMVSRQQTDIQGLKNYLVFISTGNELHG